MMRGLHTRMVQLARGWALLGGCLLLGLILMSVASVLGRWLLNAPVQGDFEFIQLGSAVCVAACLPLCQLRDGNIIVDFFTTRTDANTQRTLDCLGALLLAVVAAGLAWLTAVGAISVRDGGETSMLRSVPIWWVYAAMVPSFALTALMALYTAFCPGRDRDASAQPDDDSESAR